MASNQRVSKTQGLVNISLTPKGIVEFLKAGVKADQPVFLWGPPGVAKSALVQKVARDLGFDYYDFRALLHDVVDLNGLPVMSQDGKYTHWLRPRFLPELREDNKDERGIFHLDELNAAGPQMQAVCYQLVLDRKAGEHKLHPGWVPIGSGNNDTDGAVTSKMPTPLKSRFMHLNIGMEPNESIPGTQRLVNQNQWCEDWIEWGLENGLHSDVIAYHRWTAGQDLYCFSKSWQTFPCLRTWEFVSKVLKQNPPQSMLFPLIAGAIGEGHASKAYAFIQDARSLPHLEEILRNPLKVPVPTESAKKYAFVTSLAARVTTGKDFKPAVKYLERMESDFQVIAIKDMVLRTQVLRKDKDFLEWCAGPVGALIVDAMK
jgi:hypothetical protein